MKIDLKIWYEWKERTTVSNGWNYVLTNTILFIIFYFSTYFLIILVANR
jgi:hypothetical protein